MLSQQAVLHACYAGVFDGGCCRDRVPHSGHRLPQWSRSSVAPLVEGYINSQVRITKLGGASSCTNLVYA
jgi:hypothetical protein